MDKIIACKQKLEEGTCKRGFILITVTVITAVLLVLSFSLIKAITSELVISRSQKAGTVGFYLAEAGVKEAIWRVKNDPSARDKFINSEDGVTTFEHNPALIENGSYSVQIRNTAKGAAEITSTGFYNLSSQIKAQRMIKAKILLGTKSPIGNNVVLSGRERQGVELVFSSLNISGGDIHSNYDYNLFFSEIEAPQSLLTAVDRLRNSGSNVNVAGIQAVNYPPPAAALPLPGIDYDDLRSNATVVYTPSQFHELVRQSRDTGTLEFPGPITFIDGYVNFTPALVWGGRNSRINITIHGLLVVNDGFSFSSGYGPYRFNLRVVDDTNGPSGIIVRRTMTLYNPTEPIVIDGILYSNFNTRFIQNNDLTVNGAILNYHTHIGGGRVIVNGDIERINEFFSFIDQISGTQIFSTTKVSHWEEEY